MRWWVGNDSIPVALRTNSRTGAMTYARGLSLRHPTERAYVYDSYEGDGTIGGGGLTPLYIYRYGFRLR